MRVTPKNYDPFRYVYDVDEFFDDDYDPELDRSHLIKKHAKANYRAAREKGAHPLDAFDAGTDAAVVQAKQDIDSDYEPSPDEMNQLKRFCRFAGMNL